MARVQITIRRHEDIGDPEIHIRDGDEYVEIFKIVYEALMDFVVKNFARKSRNTLNRKRYIKIFIGDV